MTAQEASIQNITEDLSAGRKYSSPELMKAWIFSDAKPERRTPTVPISLIDKGIKQLIHVKETKRKNDQ